MTNCDFAFTKVRQNEALKNGAKYWRKELARKCRNLPKRLFEFFKS
jgi:hypothetical protein